MRKGLFFIRMLLVVGGIGWATGAVAQEASPTPSETRAIDQGEWEKASGTLDYSNDMPEAERKKPEQQSSNRPAPQWDFSGLGVFFQVLAIMLLVGLVGYGIYRMLQEPRNRQIARDGVEITLENIEEYLHETDLERFLREALAQKNYPQAVRLYYLQIIKNLSTKNLIRWSREKTNRDYAGELRQHPLHEPFRTATRTFERVWYGNAEITETEFRQLEPEFQALLLFENLRI